MMIILVDFFFFFGSLFIYYLCTLLFLFSNLNNIILLHIKSLFICNIKNLAFFFYYTFTT